VQNLGTLSFPKITDEFRTTAKEDVRYKTTVRCVITVDRVVRGCLIEESIPSMDRQVLRWQRAALRDSTGEQRTGTTLVPIYIYVFSQKSIVVMRWVLRAEVMRWRPRPLPSRGLTAFAIPLAASGVLSSSSRHRPPPAPRP
jgi:hypothetical protein